MLATLQANIDHLGRVVIDTVRSFGNWLLFMGQALIFLPKRPFRWRIFLNQMEFIGVKSSAIIVLTGTFVGMVFALQIGKALANFNAESTAGAVIGLSLTREIGPVFTVLMIVARACSSMAAEIGTMRVTEQIDALETMAVDPIHFLAVPRIVATVIMAPLLTALFNFIGMIGAWFVGVRLLMIKEGPFLNKLFYYVDPEDFMGGLIKAAIFGFLAAGISCYQGYVTEGGAVGVGRATTRAVVISSVTILVTDYFLTTWILEFFARGYV